MIPPSRRDASPPSRRRRELLQALGLVLATPLLAGCRLTSTSPGGGAAGDARLHARPGTPTASITPGLHPLGLDGGRDGWIVVPTGYDAARRWPMAVFFHGAVTPPRAYMDAFLPFANEAGLVLLAPESRAPTWDAIHGVFGPDVAFVDRALGELFRRVAVDPARMALCGFSDGGTYALSLGLANGDAMRRVAAYSPGFIVDDARRGTPAFFVTHGTDDTVLPIAATSRRIVPRLRGMGYTVEYREFAGGHGVPLPLARESLRWMAA